MPAGPSALTYARAQLVARGGRANTHIQWWSTLRENTKQKHTKVSIHLHLRVYDQPLHLNRLRELVQERSNAARLQLRQRRVPIEGQRLGDRRQSRRSVT